MASASVPAETLKFQLALPLALHSISPSLSALHTSRARLYSRTHQQANSLVPSFACSKCGTLLVPEAGRIRTKRETNSPSTSLATSGGVSASANTKTKTLLKSCLACGFRDRLVGDSLTAGAFVSPRRLAKSQRKAELDKTSRPPPILEPSASPHAPPPPISIHKVATSSTVIPQAVVKPARAKKRAGLQEMLAQNRQKELEKSKAAAKSSSSLAAFLSELCVNIFAIHTYTRN